MPDLANVSRTAIFGPESVDAGNETLVRCVWWGWVADPQICEIILYRSILDIISQTHQKCGLQCFKGDGGCVSMLVCSNSFTACDAKWPGKRSHSRRNSSCILVAITSRNSCIYIYIYKYITSMIGLSFISINCHVSEISGFQCWFQLYHPISV